MTYDPKFGPAAQTPEDRAWVLYQMQQTIPSLKKSLNARSRALHAKYINGELSWSQMREAMNDGYTVY